MNDSGNIAISLLLVLGSFFFVAAEYSLVSSRKSRLEAMARKGNKVAKSIVSSIEDPNRLVATSQIAITMLGIGMGSLTEPFLTEKFKAAMGTANPAVSFVLSYTVITFVIVVLGELVPKFLVIRSPEPWALITTLPLVWLSKVIYPLVWLAQTAAGLILRPFGIKLDTKEGPLLAKEELQMMLRSGQSDLDGLHASVVAKAMKLDDLDARDIMIHRLDIKFLDSNTPTEHVLGKVGKIPHTRIPVCNGDIDDLIGIVYLNDIVRTWGDDNFSLERLTRPAVVVPENLTLDKVITRMRDDRTQILIVVDEYGGTSGLITLEDVVEEIFGELEDRIESDRPPIEVHPSGRVSARAETRFDELVNYLGFELDDPTTDTLAQLFADKLERIPKMGDQIDSEIGKMRVENMARRRLTRVSIRLKAPTKAPPNSL